MERITISIPEELKEKLTKTAQENDRSISWVAKEILQKYYIKEEEGETKCQNTI